MTHLEAAIRALNEAAYVALRAYLSSDTECGDNEARDIRAELISLARRTDKLVDAL